MIDWQGNIIEMNHCQSILLEDVDEDIIIASAVHIVLVECKVGEKILQLNNNNNS